MDRYFVRTAAVVFCAAWAAGCGTSASDKANAPTVAATPAPAPRSDATADNLPTTLDGEIARAHKLRMAGSYDEAAKALGQLMIVVPDDARVVGEYGKVLTQLGRPGDALPFLNRAIQLNATDWTLYSALGVAYDQADEHAKARAAYERALQLNPGQPEVLNNLAVSRMLAGNLGDAQKLLNQASKPGAEPKIGNNLALLETMKRPAPPNGGATSGPKPLPGVMMEKVPMDPDAGPVAQRQTARHKLAQKTTQKPKPAAAPALRQQDAAQPQKPILRTAADGQ
ncbi:MAG TPA: tetratricopeptide repeat protein [Rhizomicrobium sp.]|nr:tetratricopeptide repeat protein [Rhizomicrobium sp.]